MEGKTSEYENNNSTSQKPVPVTKNILMNHYTFRYIRCAQAGLQVQVIRSSNSLAHSRTWESQTVLFNPYWRGERGKRELNYVTDRDLSNEVLGKGIKRKN